ncbi:amino acid permease [Saccharopolyspora sp. WRP15-2]|uniref:Amino acid permease n=1 Tax=Saccharopolyspora oryzae TaxID=2997343 RepID=A0ABT4V0T7_9PSEU|nr:amino acid permease [Saccharopolyspora oryzae]MDA3627553.1 amino acid permease [Saccharopolyspora oryzae]
MNDQSTSAERTQESTGASGLRPALRDRQMSMIAIGGVIGAGLFVGSGAVINKAGPAALVAYAIAGLLVVLIMRMLAELSVAAPKTGSFASYASRELGSWAGLAIGWLYAYSWSVTVGVEAVIGGALLHGILPVVPDWAAALVFLLVLTGSNLVAVRAYGEVEFWFALIKVVAIVAFIGLGLLAIFGVLPGVPAPGGTNLFGQGGFAPNGWYAVLPALLVVSFAFSGAEVVTIAAGEAMRPAEAVRRAVRTTMVRILVFYIGSIAVITTLLPYDDAGITESPYSAVLNRLGIPNAGLIMDLVVLVAVLSCLNSGIYTASRMLYALASNGEGPRVLARSNASGVPVPAVLVVALAGLATVTANYFFTTTAIFDFLVDSSGSVIVLLYLTIATTQLHSRARAERDGQHLTVRMWGYPYLSWAVVVALVAFLALMVVDPSTRHSLFLTFSVAAVAVTVGLVRQKRGSISIERP